MKVIGITGGVGAGKSRILSILRETYHAEIIQADEVAKELEEPGREGYLRLVKQFGAGILDETGAIDRKRFAELIFSDEEALRAVNEIIHPLTWEAIQQKAAESSAELVAVEAALFDENSRALCGELWYVDTSAENRIWRLMENRDYTREKCLDIMKNQRDRQEFLELADVLIDNNGTIEAVEEQIAAQLGVTKKIISKRNI